MFFFDPSKKLFKAARNNDWPAVRRILAQNKDLHVDARGEYGHTALMLAVWGGQAEIVQLLIDRGANVNACAAGGDTVLMQAAVFGRTEIARLLIDHGADINARNEWGETALILAIRKWHAETACLLIDRGADIHVRSCMGHTALTRAKERNFKEIVEMLEAAPMPVEGFKPKEPWQALTTPRQRPLLS